MSTKTVKVEEQTYRVLSGTRVLGEVSKTWRRSGGNAWYVGGVLVGNLSRPFPTLRSAVKALESERGV